jgi:hypothetical protein
LFGAGEEKIGGVTPDGPRGSRRGFTQAEIEAVWKAGGKLSLPQVLRCRVKHFTEGLALGGSRFLASYGEGRGGRGSARTIEGAEFGGLMFFGSRKDKDDGIRAPG